MRKVSIVGTVGVPACYGGFETLVENLLDHNKADFLYIVYCSGKIYKKKLVTYKSAELRYINLNANGWSSIFYDFIGMLRSLDTDTMLILGVSGSFFLPFIRYIYHGKIITNIDGLEWKRDKWKKPIKYILHLFEKIAVGYSDIIVGDNKEIIKYVKDYYKKKSELIEYGANHAKNNYDPDLKDAYPFIETKYAVSICRIEPENNISIILKAFASQNNLALVMIGNWTSSEYGRSLFIKYSHYKHIYLYEPEYDIDKINYIRCHAKLYIHGHSAGGTNPSLVEAMHLGLPILAYDCAYNRATTENSCLYWKDANELKSFIMTCRFENNGVSMKKIADRRYTWEIIAAKYEALF